MSGPIQRQIEKKLAAVFSPVHLEVLNESHMHSVAPGSESHFKLTVVSDAFEGEGLLARHRLVNECLAEELAGPVHAIAMHTYSPEQWTARQNSPDSPNCKGGFGL